MTRDKGGLPMNSNVKVLTLDSDEQALMVNGLNGFRKVLLEQDKPTEDLEDLLLRVIDAPTKKEKRRMEREAR